MQAYQIEIHGSFFNDAGWDYDPVRLDKIFTSKTEASIYADKIESGEIEVDEWDRFQDPDNTVNVIEVEIP